MWEDTLIVVTSDNGGPMYSDNAANNFPLRGYKFSSWEGGIRGIGAVGGGFLDPANAGGGYHRRPLGSRLEGMTQGNFAIIVVHFSRISQPRPSPPRAVCYCMLYVCPCLSGADWGLESNVHGCSIGSGFLIL